MILLILTLTICNRFGASNGVLTVCKLLISSMPRNSSHKNLEVALLFRAPVPFSFPFHAHVSLSEAIVLTRY